MRKGDFPGTSLSRPYPLHSVAEWVNSGQSNPGLPRGLAVSILTRRSIRIGVSPIFFMKSTPERSMGASPKAPQKAHFLSPLLTKRLLVRILLGEPNISHFEILSAFWLTQQRHILAEMGDIARWPATLSYGDIPRWLVQIGSPPHFELETLTVSAGTCTFG